MAKEYRAGDGSGVIGRRYGIHASTVCSLLVRHAGVLLRPYTRTHELNERALDDAETNPTSAYYVGLLFADGCISEDFRKKPNYKITLALRGEDVEHVQDFRSFLSSGHKVSIRDNSQGYGNGTMAFIQFYSRHMAETLLRFGIGPRKSSSAKVAFLENNSHFWRGVLCGDGWVSFNNDIPYIGITGSFDSCQQFLVFVKTFLPAANVKVAKNGTGNSFKIAFTNRLAVAILRKLFTPDCISLRCKKEIAEKILSQNAHHPDSWFLAKNAKYHLSTREQLIEAYIAKGTWTKAAYHLGIHSQSIQNLVRKFGLVGFKT